MLILIWLLWSAVQAWIRWQLLAHGPEGHSEFSRTFAFGQRSPTLEQGTLGKAWACSYRDLLSAEAWACEDWHCQPVVVNWERILSSDLRIWRFLNRSGRGCWSAKPPLAHFDLHQRLFRPDPSWAVLVEPARLRGWLSGRQTARGFLQQECAWCKACCW